MKLKSKCCKKFKKKKGNSCKSCPIVSILGKKERGDFLKKYH